MTAASEAAAITGAGPERLADRVYADIIAIIDEGRLAPGDRLPSESGLAQRCGASRTIVREALARLASDGITRSRRGAGSYVKRRPSERLGAHVPPTGIAAAFGTYELRFVLEAEAARLAARRRSSAQLAAIEDALEALRNALLSSAPAHEEDWLLHRAIALATANGAFVSAFDQLRDDLLRVLKAGVDISRSRPPEAIAAMIGEHDGIVDAIRAGDGDGAALAMRWHLFQGRKRLMPDG